MGTTEPEKNIQSGRFLFLTALFMSAVDMLILYIFIRVVHAQMPGDKSPMLDGMPLSTGVSTLAALLSFWSANIFFGNRSIEKKTSTNVSTSFIQYCVPVLAIFTGGIMPTFSAFMMTQYWRSTVPFLILLYTLIYMFVFFIIFFAHLCNEDT
jgi:hypothetical protein